MVAPEVSAAQADEVGFVDSGGGLPRMAEVVYSYTLYTHLT